jgi:hypothetical protein
VDYFHLEINNSFPERVLGFGLWELGINFFQNFDFNQFVMEGRSLAVFQNYQERIGPKKVSIVFQILGVGMNLLNFS